MNSPIIFSLMIIVALLMGLGIGWLVGARAQGGWHKRFLERDNEARALEEQFRKAIADLAGASVKAENADCLSAEVQFLGANNATLQAQVAALSERASLVDSLNDEVNEGRKEHDVLRRDQASLKAQIGALTERTHYADQMAEDLAEVRKDRENLRAELASLKANSDNFQEQKRLLLESREELQKQFEAAGAKVLESAQEAFLRRAQDRFSESEKTSAERLSALLNPVHENLRKYEQQVQELEAKRVDSFGQLAGTIEAMRIAQEQVRAEAARLGNSLRNAPKARGRWGEQQLRNVLEQCGLAEHTDFITEHSIDTEEGRLRPDALLRVPGNKILVIDAKVSLNAYQDAYEAETEEARQHHLGQHAASMRNHIQTLATKSYQSQFEDAPDYVLMFVPGEHFIGAALEFDSQLWDYAFERRVLLASPTNLVAIARTIAQVWRQDGLAREAKEIGRIGGELYDRLAMAGEHLKRVGSGLGSAVDNYNKFVGSFERNVMSSGRKLREKHIEIGKREIEDLAVIESRPRYDVEQEQSAIAIGRFD